MSNSTLKISSSKSTEETNGNSDKADINGISKESGLPYDDTLTKLPATVTKHEFYHEIKKEVRGIGIDESSPRKLSSIEHKKRLAELENELGAGSDDDSSIEGDKDVKVKAEKSVEGADLFRKLQQQPNVPFEYDTDLGIVLDQKSEGHGEDSTLGSSIGSLDLNGPIDVKDILGNINEQSTQEESDDEDDDDIKHIKRRKVAKVADISEITEVNDTTGDFEHPLNSDGGAKDAESDTDSSDDIQVPSSGNARVNRYTANVLTPVGSQKIQKATAEKLLSNILPGNIGSHDTQVIASPEADSRRVKIRHSERILVSSSPGTSPRHSQKPAQTVDTTDESQGKGILDKSSSQKILGYPETLKIEESESCSGQSLPAVLKDTLDVSSGSVDESAKGSLDNAMAKIEEKDESTDQILRKEDKKVNIKDYEPFQFVLVRDRSKEVPMRIQDAYRDESDKVVFSVCNSHDEAILPKNAVLAPLLLQIGTHVKYIKQKKFIYRITGLEYRENEDDETREKSLRCLRGYNTLYLKRYRKAGLPPNSVAFKEELTVPIDDIYMDSSCYRSYPFRLFDEESEFEEFVSSCLLRHNQQNRKVSEKSSRCFEGCCFFLTVPTGVDDQIDGDKLADVEKFLTKHGATVFPNMDSLVRVTATRGFGTYRIRRDAELRKYRFVALLSMKHIRTLKYLQFLALGWPILSIQFALDAMKSKECRCKWQQMWTSYLLPAGNSSYRKCVLSLNIFDFVEKWKLGKTLYEQVEYNSSLVDGASILVDIKTEEGIASEDLMFLLQLLGFKRILFLENGLRPQDMSLVIGKLQNYDESDKYYVYTNGGSGALSKVMDKCGAMDLSNVTLCAVEWEWLVQCLIAGYAFEPTGKWSGK